MIPLLPLSDSVALCVLLIALCAVLVRALALAEGYGPGYEQARALNSLGALLREMNRPAEAEALHRRALPLTESFGYEPHVASTLGNMDSIWMISGIIGLCPSR